MTRRTLIAIAVSLATAAGVAGIAVAAPAGAEESRDDAVVRTGDGPVRGIVAADHRTFQGIPYAAPPEGALRWAAPRPPARWTDTRDATRPGSACPQTAGFLGDPASFDEDCLFLNVTTPRRTGNRLKPVMVFIHGGGFYSGSSDLYGARALATQGDVVVVTPNYRLGVFGFLDHPALGATAANFGLQDQQAALRWVRRNAAAFGGDPANVTLVGESAGSVSTCSHLVSPSSAGLFRRAIMQSGTCGETDEWPYQDGGNWYPRSRAVAEREGVAAATTLKCADPATVEACLRGKSTAELLEVSGGGQGFGPVYGGGLLPIAPKQALADRPLQPGAGDARHHPRRAPVVHRRHRAVHRPRHHRRRLPHRGPHGPRGREGRQGAGPLPGRVLRLSGRGAGPGLDRPRLVLHRARRRTGR